jgi:hypothetical protein
MRISSYRLLHLASILEVLKLVTDAEEVSTTGTTVVHWTDKESLMQLEQEVSFNTHENSGTVTHSDAGFHHNILPGLVTYQDQEEAEIRYEPDEVKPEVEWEALLNMRPAGDDGFDPLPVFDVEWGADLHGACDCWNTTEDGCDVEVECGCGGQELTDIPSNLASNVHRM